MYKKLNYLILIALFVTALSMLSSCSSVDTDPTAVLKNTTSTKCGEGKCGEGKCGEGKCGEGKCGKEKVEEKCGEGKCGEGKCGA